MEGVCDLPSAGIGGANLMTEPTPRPWRASNYEGHLILDDAGGHHLAVMHKTHYGNELPAESNAALIVQAVNSFDALLAVYEAAKKYIPKPSNIQAAVVTAHELRDAVHAADAALEGNDA